MGYRDVKSRIGCGGSLGICRLFCGANLKVQLGIDIDASYYSVIVKNTALYQHGSEEVAIEVSMTSGFIPPHGGYEELASYQKAEIVFDATVHFCSRFLDRFDRTRDQMIQAARSGKQNIIEGSMASGTSRETEIKLTGVARASLEELLADYRDFLRIRGMRLWDKNSKEALYVRKLRQRTHTSHSSHRSQSIAAANGTNMTYETYRTFIETRGAEVAANIVICLIHQANYLLDRQLAQLEKDFLNHGGLREAMRRARLNHRRTTEGSDGE